MTRPSASPSLALPPLSIEESLVRLSAGARRRAHTRVNVSQPLGDRAGAVVAFERFFAGDAHRFGQAEISDAGQPPHRVCGGLTLDVERHLCSWFHVHVYTTMYTFNLGLQPVSD